MQVFVVFSSRLREVSLFHCVNHLFVFTKVQKSIDIRASYMLKMY